MAVLEDRLRTLATLSIGTVVGPPAFPLLVIPIRVLQTLLLACRAMALWKWQFPPLVRPVMVTISGSLLRRPWQRRLVACLRQVRRPLLSMNTDTPGLRLRPLLPLMAATYVRPPLTNAPTLVASAVTAYDFPARRRLYQPPYTLVHPKSSRFYSETS